MNLGQVYTTRIVADYMAQLFTLPNGSHILDPCFGRGAFLEALARVGKYEVDGIEIDTESYLHCQQRFSPVCSLRHGNFFDIATAYDGIIMNPPYVRHEEINELASLGVNKERLASSVSCKLDAKSNLYMYFVAHGLELLRDGGEMIVIFPNSWEKAKSGVSFKKLIERECSITEHIDVRGNPFDGDPIVDVEILKIKKRQHQPTIYKKLNVDEGKITVNTYECDGNMNLGNTMPLSFLATVRRGKTTGYNKMFINPSLIDMTLLVDIVSSPKDVRGFTTKDCHTDKYLYIRSGDAVVGDTKQYLDDCAKTILKEREPKSLYEAILTKKRWYDTSSAWVGDIVFPYIVRDNIRFIKNDWKLMVRDNFYTINTHEDPYLLMSLLNNHFVWYQLEKCGKTYGNSVLKIQKYDVDLLNVVKPNVISDTDTALLKIYGRQLTADANISIVEGITDILSRYYGVDNIKNIYEDTRRERFGK